MKFNFNRSVVLGALIKNPNGSVTVRPAIAGWSVTISSKNVHYEVISSRHDTSVLVVDLGPKGQSTDEIIVGVGHMDKVRDINHNRYYQSLHDWVSQKVA